MTDDEKIAIAEEHLRVARLEHNSQRIEYWEKELVTMKAAQHRMKADAAIAPAQSV